eukprot:5579142-Pyramimonas_sp.AAC.1
MGKLIFLACLPFGRPLRPRRPKTLGPRGIQADRGCPQEGTKTAHEGAKTAHEGAKPPKNAPRRRPRRRRGT